MTRSEIHIAVLQGVNGFDAHSGYYLEPEQIDHFFNRMTERFIKQRYYMMSNAKQRGFEDNQKRLADLQGILSTTVITPASQTSGIARFNLSSVNPTYFLFVRLGLNVLRNNAILTNRPCRIVEIEDIDFILEDPFTGTIYQSPIGTISNNQIQVYTKGQFTIQQGELTYIRKFTNMSSGYPTCELPVHTHSEIVDMTITYIKKTNENPAYQIEAADELKTE